MLGCATEPKSFSKQESAIERQAVSYDKTAQSYREQGNTSMTSYYEKKARETRERKKKINYGFLDFVLDMIFKSSD